MSTNFPLLPGEEFVMSSDNNILVLTTERVRYDSVTFGSSRVVSITLDSVASCGLVTMSHPVLLLLGAVAVVGAFALSGDAQPLLVAVAIVLVFVYLVTRRAVISIASNGGETITVPAKGMSRSTIVDFLNAVEREKLR
jgi:hypothetical protein